MAVFLGSNKNGDAGVSTFIVDRFKYGHSSHAKQAQGTKQLSLKL